MVTVVALEAFRDRWQDFLERELTAWLADPTRGALVMLALTSPLWLFAWFLRRTARRMSNPEHAQQARAMDLLAVVTAILPFAVAGVFWWLLQALGR